MPAVRKKGNPMKSVTEYILKVVSQFALGFAFGIGMYVAFYVLALMGAFPGAS